MGIGNTVIVHGFQRYNTGKGENEVSRYKATPKAIERLKCAIVKGTAETVDASLLDDLGRYKPQKN